MSGAAIGLEQRPLTDSEITATLSVIRGENGQLPPPLGDDQMWMIADLTDGRLTGRRDPGGTWVRSDQIFPADCPAPPQAAENWRLLQLRLFTRTCEIIIVGGSTASGWMFTDTAAPEWPHAPRDRKFLVGPRRAHITHLDGFSKLEDTSGGSVLVLPLHWQPPASAAKSSTNGTWLHTREYFAADRHLEPGGSTTGTGAVGVVHTRYTAFTTDTTEASA